MNNKQQQTAWSENVILVDADYVDCVAFDLIVNFERMIGRRIPQADLARWIDCVALDGGLRQGSHQTQVVFIHDKDQQGLKNFLPGSYADELDGKAFSDHLGEFILSAYPVEPMVSRDDYFLDALQMVCTASDVKRVMVIPDSDRLYNNVRDCLQRIDDELTASGELGLGQKRITVFTMQPQTGGPFRHEILGYSLMAALGISSEELKVES